MSRNVLSLIASLSLLACNATATGCPAQLAAYPIEDEVRVDLEEIFPNPALLREGIWDEITPLPVSCTAPTGLPNWHPLNDEFPAERFRPKPVQVVRLASERGVVFVYPAQGEFELLDGLAAVLVMYNDAGEVDEVIEAASFLRFEGYGRLTSSAITPAEMFVCQQEMEFFEYAGNGDIIGELPRPVRGEETCVVRQRP